jgi:signal transduction histidine kinase
MNMVAPPPPAPTISLEPPSPAARYAALILTILSVVLIAVLGPIAKRPMGEAAVFLPAYQCTLIVVDLVTAVLLYGEFRAGRALALLVLTAAYLFEVGSLVIYTLSFPGLFGPTGMIGGGSQAPSWLWLMWHGGFVGAIWAYALMTRRTMGSRVQEVGAATAGALLAIAAALLLMLALVTVWHDHLPTLMVAGDYSRSVGQGVGPAVLLACVAGAALLWRNRRRSVVDLWLVVVLVTWACDVALSGVLGASRFDLGWYAGRAFGLLSSVILLIVLLLENQAGQARLIEARRRLAHREHLQALGQLTGGVAHDFNNMLFVLQGSLDAIERNAGAPAQVKRYTEIARSGLASGTTLAQQLLTFAGRQHSTRETLDLNKVLTHFEPLVKQALADRIALALSLGPPAPATIDRGQFEAAILNLAVNARHAMKDIGRLVIRTDGVTLRAGELADLSAGAYVAVWVTDNGVGMTEEVAAKAITPFFTTKTGAKDSGSGLGLSQVYGFVRASGGDLEIKTQPGRGTSIGLFLPRAVS